MGKQEHSGRVEEKVKNPLRYRTGPFSGKTCHVDRIDRVKVKVELGFRTSQVVEVSLKNLTLTGLLPEVYASLKSCLVVLIGGHSIILDEVDDPWDGVHACRVFVPCANPPQEVLRRVDGEKVYMDLGDYLDTTGRALDFDPDAVKKDYTNRR